jgi:ribonucleotide monophosphatase NagD (HAD superfamily)
MGTDILGGHRAGLATLLVTGGLAARLVGGPGGVLDPSRLSTWLANQPVTPDYVISGLR